MYPRNAASPPRIAIGAVVQISDGAVQGSGVSVVVQPEGGSESAGGGTVAYSAASGSVLYTPTQAETNYTAFIVTAYKTGCIPVSQTIVTTANATAGNVHVGSIANDAITAASAASDLTTELQSGLATASALSTLQTSVDDVPTNAELSTALAAADDAVLAAVAALPVPLTASGIRSAVGLASANLDTQISTLATASNLSTVAGYLDTEIAAILADTNELQTDWANGGRLDLILDARASQASVDTIDGIVDSILVDTAEIGAAGAGLTAITAVTDKLDDTLEDDAGTYRFTTNALEQAPSGSGASAADIADAVWEEALGDHSATSGSTAEALAAAGGAGDPWITPLPGSYTSGQAGKIVGDYLNASVSSRATQTSVDDVPTNAELATALAAADDAVLAAVADLPTNAELATALGTADDAVLSAISALSIPTATQNADALLNRDMSAVSDTNARSPLNALRFIRNKWTITTGTLSVKKEDDTTEAWTAAVSTTPGADPVTGNDPA